MLRVNELFATIQGEATWVGTPSTFIRLQGCPVGCAWCDTKHTWPANEKKRISAPEMLGKTDAAPTWSAMSDSEIMVAALSLTPRHFVVTGGEPCVYDLSGLTKKLQSTGTVQVETSGTHEIKVSEKTWVTVSPKIGMSGGFAVRGDAMRRANEIKFPVQSTRDITVLADLLDHYPSDGRVVWLQPVSQDDTATKLCLEVCQLTGWRISLQLHKYAGLR